MIFGTKPWGDDLIKTDLGYIGPVKGWETSVYRLIKGIPSGISDWIYNQCRMIMQTEDKSPWAYLVLKMCISLLETPSRWPIHLQIEIPENRQCKTRLCSFYNKYKFKLLKWIGIYKWLDNKESKLAKKAYQWSRVKLRSRNDMTKDPYIAVFACAMFLGKLNVIEEISIPYYLYRPSTWSWHRYLKDPTEENWDKYDITYDHQVKSSLEFVNVLREMRAWTALEMQYLINENYE